MPPGSADHCVRQNARSEPLLIGRFAIERSRNNLCLVLTHQKADGISKSFAALRVAELSDNQSS